MIIGEFYTDKARKLSHYIAGRVVYGEEKDAQFMRLAGDNVNYNFNLDALFPLNKNQLAAFKKIFEKCNSETLNKLVEYLQGRKETKPVIAKRLYNNIEFFQNLKAADEVIYTVHVKPAGECYRTCLAGLLK